MDDAERWRWLMAQQHAGNLVEGRVVEALAGGLMVDVQGVRAFLPLSRIAGLFEHGYDQLAVRRTLETRIGQTIRVRLLEVSPPGPGGKGQLVADQKAASAP
jgi:ribosomal protein S1